MSTFLRRTAGALGLTATVMVGGAALPSAVSAQAQPQPPTLTAGPSPIAPGGTFTATATCPTEPILAIHPEYQDYILPVPMDPTGTPSTWTFELPVERTDLFLDLECPGLPGGRAVIDVDAPDLFFDTSMSQLAGAVPHQIIGKDCPVGSTATVTYQVGDDDPVVLEVATEPDGDFVVDLPAEAATDGVTASATCGTIDDLDAIVWVGTTTPTTGPPTTATTSTTVPGSTTSGSTTPRAGAHPAVPATPQPASANFTG